MGPKGKAKIHNSEPHLIITVFPKHWRNKTLLKQKKISKNLQSAALYKQFCLQ